jgi:hypothetical protein
MAWQPRMNTDAAKRMAAQRDPGNGKGALVVATGGAPAQAAYLCTSSMPSYGGDSLWSAAKNGSSK